MKKIISGALIIIFFFYILTVPSCTLTSPNKSPALSEQITPSLSISQTETSVDIGAIFEKDHSQIKYVSLAPVVTRSEAIAIAENELRPFNFDTKIFPADATVALYSGDVQQANRRSASDVPAWIVVLKEVPFVGSAGPPDPNMPNFTIKAISQLNIAIDATTSEVLYGVITSKVERIPIP
jgi:hypothetical protein